VIMPEQSVISGTWRRALNPNNSSENIVMEYALAFKIERWIGSRTARSRSCPVGSGARRRVSSARPGAYDCVP
jgi:hypothetical protein